ncbi:nitrogen fixation protein NifX [Rhodovulum adriaticum]|uniref:Nitrogen fixation protein NifX n=1 Tax=Rhodovulum adriaticum TaxID=35804 RepID=A0A4V2SKW7_RHOAD|nr:nitrogen fixation protein NifX [Rhodovulum adriaticum]MBK1635838.1 nitrogen fixation protein NifX [Rhodovulum adriaticum]TCP20996.1 nitrogen fixation protein NifX [Rhodovulum adriaticum]
MTARRLRLIEPEETMTSETPLKIAIATNDMEHLDAHFGSAKKFALYEVTPQTARMVEVLEFGDVTDQQGEHNSVDDRITPKVEALSGCALLFVLAIGGPSAAKVVRAGIHPIKRREPEPIADVIAQTQEMLAGSPPPFLRKVLGKPKSDFAEDYAEEITE